MTLCFKPGEKMRDDFFSVSDKDLYYLEKGNPSFSTGDKTMIFQLCVLLATQSDIKQ